jgi:hypothetical protein
MTERLLHGVLPVDNKELVKGVKQALARGTEIGRTVKLTGMPYEEVAKIRDRMRRKGVVR